METEKKTIYVYSGWGNRPPALMGLLYVNDSRGKEIFSFEYKKEWIRSSGFGFIIDPDLFLLEGRQYVPLGKSLFGIFTDPCPDRWGRLLMNRKEAILARKDGFLLTERGWTLSPAYDVNPNIYGNTLSLNVNADDNSARFDLAMETAKYYDMDIINAKNVLAYIKKTIEGNWRTLAAYYGLSRSAIDRMAPAFAMEYK